MRSRRHDEYLTKPLHVAALAQALERWTAAPDSPSAPVSAAVQPAPAIAESEVLLLDPARLEEFKEFDDDELTMTKEVVALFVADAPMRMHAIEEAIAGGDAAALAKAAHALKGSASNIGAAAMQREAAALEATASQGEIGDAAATAVRLRDLWSRTQPLMAAWA